MNFKKPLPLPAPAAREVSLHLWAASEAPRPLDWKGIQSLLVRRRKPLLITFALAMGHLLLALWMLAPQYRATATLKINTASSSGGESDLPFVSELTGAGESRTLTTQIHILANDGVRHRALALLPPRERAAVGIKSASVKAVPDTPYLEITTASRNPDAAAAYSNALANAYLRLSRETNGSQYAAASQAVGKQLNATQTRLNRTRRAIADYKKAQRTADLPAETAGLIAERDRVEAERSGARTDKEARLASLQNLRATLPSLPENVVASSTIAKRPSVIAKQASLTQLETQLITARGEYAESAPEVRQLRDQIALLRDQLRTEAQTEVQTSNSAVNPARQATEQNITQLQGEVWSLEARGVALKARAKFVEAELARLPEREQRLGQLNTDLTGLQQRYELLNQKYQSLRATEAARVASGSLLFPAQKPTGADSRLTPFNLALSLALASLLALAVAALIDRVDSRVHSPRDLGTGGELPVLAQIPFILNGSAQSLLQLQSPSPLLENFRGLRTVLALSGSEDGQSVRSLVVTSSLPQEGKSLTALNLAVAAARGGERVILVDCDLRRPSQHRLCGLNNQVGFISVAQGEATLDAALQTTDVPGLRVLTSGPLASNPFHALNSRSGREILRRLEELADFVVIDTPPVLVLADARVTASCADSTLLVVSTEEPEREEVALATDLLQQSGAHLAGIVLNKVAPGPDFRDYYSRYPYYTVAVEEGHRTSNDHASNGHASNGHASNGSASNGHASNGSNGGESAIRRRLRAVKPDENGDDDEGTTMISYRPAGSDRDD